GAVDRAAAISRPGRTHIVEREVEWHNLIGCPRARTVPELVGGIGCPQREHTSSTAFSITGNASLRATTIGAPTIGAALLARSASWLTGISDSHCNSVGLP